MSLDSTTPTDNGVETNQRADPWQPPERLWSFTSINGRVIGALDPTVLHPHPQPAANKNGPTTVSPQEITSPMAPGIRVKTTDFGKRRFLVLSEWQGVVEEVNDSTFLGRLAPVEDGSLNLSRVEFTEFSFDDIADDSDRPLVEPGAVFYWTLGSSQNVAGTRTNVSLVRFRRIPPPSPYQRRRARREAEAILGNDPST